MSFLLFINCKTTQPKSEFVGKSIVNEYYSTGEIKSTGTIEDLHKEYFNFKIGFWREFYKNGKLKASGNYQLDTYKQCCTGGVCDGYYSYKFGEWNYYHENGTLKSTGKYRIGKKHINTSCKDGDEINFGYVNDNWKFYDSNGNEIEPSKSDIAEIEETSFLDQWDMQKK